MGLALMAAKRSADPSTQVGCVIVKNDNSIASLGYNGFPRNTKNGDFNWIGKGEWINTKYPYVVHAEMNALLSAKGIDLTNCKVYVTLAPCNECAKAMVQAGIKEVVYYNDKHKDMDVFRAGKIILKKAGIACKPYQMKNIEVKIKL